jgi:lysylphosphatidylglycerol synthetase-like protein (DUF2156 family)
MNDFTAHGNIDQKFLETWVHRWGNSFSEILIDKPCHYFMLPHIEGFVGYYVKSGCAVTFGDPVCSPENNRELAEAFSKFTQDNRWNTVFIFASEEFSKWAIKNTCKIMLDVGKELIFDPQCDPLKAKKGNNLRNNFHHASDKGLQAHEYVLKNEELEKTFVNVGKEWLCAKKGRQIYLTRLDLFSHPKGKRWFYLTEGDKIVGIALLSRLEHYSGWLLKYLFVLQNAPKGSSEFLMVSILAQLKQENCRFLTYGTVPADQIGEIVGLNTIKSSLIRFIYSLTKRLFHLNNKKIYWQKFHPIEQSTYILANHSLGLRELYAIKQVLNVEI